MKVAGIVLTVIGIPASSAGYILIFENIFSTKITGDWVYVAINSLSIGGMLCLAAGIPLWIVGAVKERDYRREKQVNIELQIMKFPYSGHSSVEGLKLIMEKTGARDVILVHGDKRNQEYILDYVKDVAQPRVLKESFPEKLRSV